MGLHHWAPATFVLANHVMAFIPAVADEYPVMSAGLDRKSAEWASGRDTTLPPSEEAWAEEGSFMNSNAVCRLWLLTGKTQSESDNMMENCFFFIIT